MPICDVLIIGSGIAGLSLAIKLNREFPNRKIYIVTKGHELESNTRYAQGGISVVCDLVNDSFENHIADTLRAGDGLCRKNVVDKVINYGQRALGDLIDLGVDLDRDPNGDMMLGKEGGHSASRIVHYKDMTGFQILVTLLAKVKTLPNIFLLSHHSAIDLITSQQVSGWMTESNDCYGAIILNNKTGIAEKYISRVTVMATGGVGHVYKVTTNPSVASGDGIAMAHRAGASIRHMEFIQFHPTAFYSKNNEAPHFLISEAIRGYGAFVRNHEGERFLFDHHPLGELACRDVVARAIEHEITNSGHPCVYLDCTHLPAQQLVRDFPNINAFCIANDIDITKDLIPVAPAAHYLCGGIEVDLSARTSVGHLYAVGECSYTGLHGANRLASNSLLEAVAFAEFCFKDIRNIIASSPINSSALHTSDPLSIDTRSTDGVVVLKNKVQKLMTRYVGISRSVRGLSYALGYLQLVEKRLKEFYPNNTSIEVLELRNIVATARLIVVQSLNRKVNKGTFYNVDLDTNHTLDSRRTELYI